ncbi:MAG: 5'-nucleotidase C-terminal domain-containing protein [Paracoccaceae bacterium]|nr:5'-nucleotidase C-terminal domain-containing protein [Paracoccaceae bacterium]
MAPATSDIFGARRVQGLGVRNGCLDHGSNAGSGKRSKCAERDPSGGGICASFDAGKVTVGEVLKVLPFQNTLSTFDVSSSTLLATLEEGSVK